MYDRVCIVPPFPRLAPDIERPEAPPVRSVRRLVRYTPTKHIVILERSPDQVASPGPQECSKPSRRRP